MKMPMCHKNVASNSANQTNSIDANDNSLSEKSQDIGIFIPNKGNSNASVENGITQIVNSPSAPFIDDFSDTAQGHILPIGFMNIADQRTAFEPPPPSYDQLFTPESTNVERPNSPDSELTNHVSTPSSSECGTDNTTDPAYKKITRVVWNGHRYVCTTGSVQNYSMNDLAALKMMSINNQKELLNRLYGFLGMIVVTIILWMSLVRFNGGL